MVRVFSIFMFGKFQCSFIRYLFLNKSCVEDRRTTNEGILLRSWTRCWVLDVQKWVLNTLQQFWDLMNIEVSTRLQRSTIFADCQIGQGHCSEHLAVLKRCGNLKTIGGKYVSRILWDFPLIPRGTESISRLAVWPSLTFTRSAPIRHWARFKDAEGSVYNRLIKAG